MVDGAEEGQLKGPIDFLAPYRLRPVLMESAIARGRVLGRQEPHREPPTECLARASSSCHTDSSMSVRMDELKSSGARKEYCGG